jgi:hypothetical protein
MELSSMNEQLRKIVVQARLTIPAGILALSLQPLAADEIATGPGDPAIGVDERQQHFSMNASHGALRQAESSAGVFQQLEVRDGARPSYRYRLAAGALSLDLWYLAPDSPAWARRSWAGNIIAMN